MPTSPLAPPSDDKRWRIVNATMRRHGHSAHALIETLHSVQESFGCLDDTALRYVATSLGLPASRVYGVATFYNAFTMQPQGEHTCVVCMGTACYIKGAASLVQAARDKAGIGPGETTSDNRISLLEAHCLGACNIAPAGVFDGVVKGNLEADDITQQLHTWMEP